MAAGTSLKRPRRTMKRLLLIGLALGLAAVGVILLLVTLLASLVS